MDSPKYNRTPHFPWSPGKGDEDKVASSVSSLIGKPLIITEKMDGSNTSLEKKGCFARTHASAPKHDSFDALKALHASVSYSIPEHIQLFGEWCYARHSIEYKELPGYFLLFGIRYLNLTPYKWWGSWEEISMWANKLAIPTVPVLFSGMVESEKELRHIVEVLASEPSVCGGEREGVVVRSRHAFRDDEFAFNIMKWVRKNHVQTDEHWKNQEIVRNGLKPNS
jgi:hypothetical protein